MKAENGQTINITIVASKVNLTKANQQLPEMYGRHRYRDALFLQTDDCTAVVFDYGVMVTWATTEQHRAQLCEMLQPYCDGFNAHNEWELFHFEVTQGDNISVSADTFKLPNLQPLTILAASHALAQSEKLEQFESRAETTVTDNAYLSDTLSRTGKIPLSRKQLAKLRGSLFKTKSDILLHFNLLDTPEFFWEYPELEGHYQAVAKYLDLRPRVELLTLKLETIHELLEMLAAEQNHKHSAVLEWIIIILIAVDIVVYFGK